MDILLLLLAITLLVNTFIVVIKNNVLSFEGGIIFATIFFFGMPSIIYVLSGSIPIDTIDFWQTNLEDIELEHSFYETIYLSLYLTSISLWVLFSIQKNTKVEHKNSNRQPNIVWFSLFLSFILGTYMFVYSGMLDGGHWYENRNNFFTQNGILAIFIIYLFIASKLVFISTFYFWYRSNKLILTWGLIVFGIYDTLLTGNRIYLFIILALLLITNLNKIKIKHIAFFLILLPFGFLISVYRMVRGRIFEDGIPDFQVIYNLYINILSDDKIGIKSQFLGMFESVNFNVVMMLFRIQPNEALFGETFFKVFTYIIPRSIWPNKPESITTIAADRLAPQADHLSLITTLFGELHFNFWLLGPFLLWPILSFAKFMIMRILPVQYEHIKAPLAFLFGILYLRMAFSDILMVFINVVFILAVYKYLSILRFRV